MFLKLLKYSGLALILLMSACGDDESAIEVLPRPAFVSVDSTNGRVFVLDNTDNVFSVILTATDRVLNDSVLTNSSSSITLPNSPTALQVLDLDGTSSRIFIADAKSSLTVLDFDGSTLSVADISPIAVGANSLDSLSDLAYDSENDRIYVANASTGELYIYSATTGTEIAQSPINIGDNPRGLAYYFDGTIGWLAVANIGSDNISLVNTSDLAAAVQTLDIGQASLAVALGENTDGIVLVATSAEANSIETYAVDTTTFSNSSLIASIDTEDDPALNGLVKDVVVGDLSDDSLKAFITLSSGDLVALDISVSGSTVDHSILDINQIPAEGIDAYFEDGSLSKVYSASPSNGSVAIVDATSDALLRVLF